MVDVDSKSPRWRDLREGVAGKVTICDFHTASLPFSRASVRWICASFRPRTSPGYLHKFTFSHAKAGSPRVSMPPFLTTIGVFGNRMVFMVVCGGRLPIRACRLKTHKTLPHPRAVSLRISACAKLSSTNSCPERPYTLPINLDPQLPMCDNAHRECQALG